MPNISIWPRDSILSGATSLVQNEPGSDSKEGVFHIPQSFGISGASPLDCLESYPAHSLGVSYPSAEMQSVYSTASAN